MQFPSASKDQFIFAPSINLIPLLFVFDALSEPARSINDNFPYLTSALIPQSLSRCSTATYRTAWDHEECWLASVGSYVHLAAPKWSSLITSEVEEAMISVTPTINIPCYASSHRSNPFSVGRSESKSQITSL